MIRSALIWLALTFAPCSMGPHVAAAGEIPIGTGAVRVTEHQRAVGRWDRWELTIRNDRTYADPFREVTLDVTYTRPDGRQVRFWGFHDGGRTWRIRFMPGAIGTWTYEARFSDGGPAMTGTFRCRGSDLPGMIAVDESNPIWLGFAGGRNLLVRSLHVGDRFFAANWPPQKRRALLDWAQSQGYNMLSVASHYLNRDAAGRGRGWQTPDLWDATARRPRPEQYRATERILDDLAARRIAVFPFAGFFGQSSDFPTRPEDQHLYLRYTLARIGPYWNILLNVAGPEPIGRNRKFQNAMAREDIERLGRLIRRLDVFGHPLSIHNPSGDDPFRRSQWSSLATLQGWKDRDWPSVYEGMLRNHTGRKPVYSQEVFWPGNTHGHGEYSDEEIRKKAYILLMAATAINFGDMRGDSSSGFSGSMELTERTQRRHDVVRRVWDFFETIPFRRMRPRPDLVDRGYCLADPGGEYVVYLDSGGSVDVRLAEGPYLVQWINARDTHDRRYGGQTRGGRKLRAPDDRGDWLLRLRRPTPRFSVNAENTGTLLDGRKFLAAGLRVSNALVSDRKTRELIDYMDEFASYGVNTLSVFFQGSRFGDVCGYREDGSLDPAYAVRMGRIIEAAAERGMVVLVGCLYYGNSRGKWETWTQHRAQHAVAATVRWLKQNGYRNVFVDVNNEQMAKFDDAGLIAAGKAADPTVVIGTSGKVTPPGADLSMHHGRADLPGKYYIQTEGTMKGGYWGSYSKRQGYYNYINIGVYPEEMKQQMLDYTDGFFNRGQGFLFASTWLQCVAPLGPNHRPGGQGTRQDPGIRWWLEHLKSKVGPHGRAAR